MRLWSASPFAMRSLMMRWECLGSVHVALARIYPGFNMLHLVALYPNTYAQDYPSQRIAPTKGNGGSTRLALTPSRFSAPASLHRATRRALLAPYGFSKCPKEPAGFESCTERERSRARHCRLTATHAYRAHANRRLGYDRGAADRAQRDARGDQDLTARP